jgi:hypothetical protein
MPAWWADPTFSGRRPVANPALASRAAKVQAFLETSRSPESSKTFLCEGHPLNAILSALAAFLAAGVRPRTPLAKAIVLVLVIKLLAIAGFGVFMLPGSGPPVVDPSAVSRLIGPSMSSPNEGGR